MHKENYPIAFDHMKTHVKCDWIIFFMHMFMRLCKLYGYILMHYVLCVMQESVLPVLERKKGK